MPTRRTRPSLPRRKRSLRHVSAWARFALSTLRSSLVPGSPLRSGRDDNKRRGVGPLKRRGGAELRLEQKRGSTTGTKKVPRVHDAARPIHQVRLNSRPRLMDCRVQSPAMTRVGIDSAAGASNSAHSSSPGSKRRGVEPRKRVHDRETRKPGVEWSRPRGEDARSADRANKERVHDRDLRKPGVEWSRPRGEDARSADRANKERVHDRD